MDVCLVIIYIVYLLQYSSHTFCFGSKNSASVWTTFQTR